VLRRTAEGCRWLKSHWVAVRDRLARYGIMTEVDLNALLKLLGKFAVANGTASFSITPQVCELAYLAVGTWSTQAPFGLLALRELPAAIRQQYQAQWPTPQAHAEELLRGIEAGMAELDARIAEFEADEEAEQEDQELDALTIADAKEADLHLRYAKEADTALTKALDAFWALKEREAPGESATADTADVAAAAESAAAEDESPPPEAEAVPPTPHGWSARIDREVAESVDALITITEGLAPAEAWGFVQQALATLPSGAVREAAIAVAEARFRNEPGARVDMSVTARDQGSYVVSSGYHSAVLAGLREIQRSMTAMTPAESPADPPLQR
jgi:hypothetical protein